MSKLFEGRRMRIRVCHMEAGNRCYDDTVPEEVNRRVIDHCSSVLMPYTYRSAENLVRDVTERPRPSSAAATSSRAFRPSASCPRSILPCAPPAHGHPLPSISPTTSRTRWRGSSWESHERGADDAGDTSSVDRSVRWV